MSGNLLPTFLGPIVPANGQTITGSLQIGSNAPTSFDSNALFGSLLSKALNANSVPGAVNPLTTAAIGALALGGTDGLSSLGTTFVNQIAAKFNTNTAGLQAQFQQMLANGQSMASIIAQIASELAGTVGDAFSLGNGTSGIIARTRMMQAFSQALAPPGTAPPSAAQQAAALAQRVVQVANIVAAGATQSQDVGQQYRYPGSSLDANSAKVSPAPNTTTDPSSAASVLAASISANLTAALPVPAFGSPTTTTNGVSPLQARIGALLGTGASPDAVVFSLAQNLGNAVAQAIGADGVTRTSLQVAYSQQLQAAAQNASPDQLAAQLAAQSYALAQQAAAHITGGVTAGLAVAPQSSNVVATTGAGTDVLQRILQRAQNAAVAAGGTAPNNATGNLHASSVSTSSVAANPDAGSGNGGANQNPGSGGNANPNVNLNALLAQSAASGNASAQGSAQTPVDAFLARFTQAVASLGQRDDTTASSTTAADVPAGATAAFLASIGSVDGSQNAQPPVPAALTTPTPSDPNNIVDQVLKGIFMRTTTSGSTEVRMKLQPENLGDVHVKLDVSNGNVNATLVAANADVRDTLLANQSQLSRQLADAGLKLQQFSVDVSGGQGNPFAYQQQPSSGGGASTRRFSSSMDDDGDEGIQPAIPTFGPPILSGVNRGLLDYLV